MIKDDGSLDPGSCHMFGIGLAVHTLAVLTAAVIHNLKQTRRTRRRKNRNPTTDGPPPHRPHHPHPSTSHTPTRAPP